MKTKHLVTVLAVASAGLAALLLLPLRGQGAGECCNAATSLASTVNAPVVGDEAFFKLPNGPSNVMFLLDNSGSMDNPVQCVDVTANWGDDAKATACQWPTTTELPKPASGVKGTCTFASTSALYWMSQLKDASGTLYTKATAPTVYDAGRATSADGLTDSPTWGSTCTGNNCMFTKGKIYPYGSWTLNTAVPIADCNSTGLGTLSAADLTACTTCLANKGFYFLYNSAGTRKVIFDGWWLNVNPPKFMTARKVIKNTVWMDSSDTTISKNLDAARFGLAVLNGTRIVVPLGPDKPHSFDATGTAASANRAATVVVRQKIIDALNHAGTGWPDLANGGTPMASALVDLGNYFSGKMGSSTSTWELTAGAVSAPWAGAGTPQCSFCWGCQNSAVLLVTDGSPNTESPIPATFNATPASWTTYDEATYVGNCGAKTGSTSTSYPKCISPSLGTATLVPRIASWLFNVDKRSEMTTPLNQTVQVSTIGYGIRANFGANSVLWNILQSTANMGGGTAYDATTPAELATQIAAAVSDVVERANSFSAPAASSLSTIHTAASEVFVTRFKPSDASTWEGHVYQWLLFDETLNGCDPTKTPGSQPAVNCRGKMVQPNFNGNSDSSGLNVCSDVFLVDTDCSVVTENVKTGVFEKQGTGGQVAVPVWDAGQVLSCPYSDCSLSKSTPGTSRAGYRTAATGQANSRTIWTWVNGVKVSVEPANVATLQPFMSVTAAWCYANLPLTKLCGGTSGVACPASAAAVTAAQLTQCATAVINHVRGYDVMDADNDGCGGPGVSSGCPVVGGTQTNGEEREPANWSKTTANSFWKLGDVFHSSPVLSKPPISQTICDTGYDNQCVPTLRSPIEFNARATQTQIASYTVAKCSAGGGTMTVDAYNKYWYDQRSRERILLVGANDGMLHAFDAGTVPGGATPDPNTCEYTFNQGTGEEVWAFVPPDLLPRLKDLLTGHQYTVDGSTMLRDIWVDGIATGISDGIKQSNEFRTIAVVTERSGGTQLTALDVTDPASPKVIWSFPPPCSDDQKYMAQSWSDFAPRPPPIGPVRFAASTGDPAPDQTRGFVEKWVVMVNGGYDPAMAQGAAVWMLDAWTGKVYWRYTNDTFKSQLSFGVGTSMFPVPGAVAMADIGDTDKSVSDSDGFFDTAVWGDMGGNVFVGRFKEPGTRDPTTGLVTNWYAARTFEEQRRTDDLQYATGRSEFFYMPELAYEPTQKALHVYVGSGNRERMMQSGQACGPDNLMACCKAGCTAVSATATDNYGSCSQVSKFTCTNGQLNLAPTTSTCGATATCGSGANFTGKVDLSITCPATSGTVSFAKAPTATCDANGLCSTVPAMGNDDLNGAYNGVCTKSRFYGVLAYGGFPEKKFTTQAEAKTFDKARFTDVAYTSNDCISLPGKSCTLIDTTRAKGVVGANLPDCTAAGSRCYANSTDPGWFYQYGDVCPTSTCPSFGTCSAEKTGSGGLVTFGCLLWNGFQPIGAQGGGDPCTGDIGTPIAYGYASDYMRGTPRGSCGFSSVSTGSTLYRAQQRSSVSPPSAPLLRVTAGARGGVQYSGLQLDPGSPPTNTVAGTRSDFSESVYWLEVPREMHSCRHDPASANSMCPGAR